jgi:hypothetical protein
MTTLELRDVTQEDRKRFEDSAKAMAVAFISSTTLISKEEAERSAELHGVGDFWVCIARTAWDYSQEKEKSIND